MADTEILLAFLVATAAFAYFPGPALLYVAAQSLACGRRAGLMATFGIHLGCYVHVLAATFGLSAVFAHVPEAYAGLKLAGAAYLIWLGVGMWRQKDGAGPIDVPAKSAWRAFAESVVVEILNPKVALFFLAFLPQFADPAAGLPVWSQFLILGVFVNFAFTSADLLCVLLAGTVAERARRGGWGLKLARKTGGALLVGLGARLALSER